MTNAAVVRKKSDGIAAAYTTMILAWMFDFRAESAGAGLAVQGAFLAVYFYGAMRFFILREGAKLYVPGLAPVVYCVSLFVAVGVARAVVQGLDVYATFRQALSAIMYLISVVTTAWMIIHADLRSLRANFAKLALGYGVMAAVVVQLFGGGVDISTARFEIIGGSVFSMIAYAPMYVLFDIYKIEITNIAVSFILIFISVTRSYPLVIAGQFLAIFPALWRFFSARLVLAGSVALVLFMSFAFASNLGFERWNERLFGARDSSGQDYTASTRLSEDQFLIDHFLESPTTIAFGNGISHETTWVNPREVGGGEEHGTGYGHNQYLSLLYIAGIIGGLPLLLLSFQQSFLALRTTFTLCKGSWGPGNNLEFLTLWGAIIVVGYTVYNFGAAAFGSRGMAIWYGVGTGLMLGGRACLANRRAAGSGQG